VRAPPISVQSAGEFTTCIHRTTTSAISCNCPRRPSRHLSASVPHSSQQLRADFRSARSRDGAFFVVTAAPGTPEAQRLRRLQASDILLRHTIAQELGIPSNSAPPAEAPPGRIHAMGMWGQVFLPSHDQHPRQREHEVTPLPPDALVVCQEIDDAIECANAITLAQADERFLSSSAPIAHADWS